MEQLAKENMPSAEILCSDAGNTSVSVKKSAVQGIPRLFSVLMAEEGLIQEWGLSETTLEEVFLRLAAQNHEVNSDVEGESDDIGRVMLMRTQADSAEQELVCVMEASRPSTIMVVEPTATTSGFEIIPVPDDSDSAQLADNGDNVVVTMDEMVMPKGTKNNAVSVAGGTDRGYGTQIVDMLIPRLKTRVEDLSRTRRKEDRSASASQRRARAAHSDYSAVASAEVGRW